MNKKKSLSKKEKQRIMAKYTKTFTKEEWKEMLTKYENEKLKSQLKINNRIKLRMMNVKD